MKARRTLNSFRGKSSHSNHPQFDKMLKNANLKTESPEKQGADGDLENLKIFADVGNINSDYQGEVPPEIANL